ncbi:helix-turn-helix domain-containing protein [Oribacterium sp. HCP28S3_H8]|uniref:helix-turn-helix domain-containing protein n=1 Tax=Oribacterium sp. HCP28S3_H8 TaxID=3438945 RepID=UPI00304048EC|nr:helix-turn-helix transcriptional regulator [Oribacterium sp.]
MISYSPFWQTLAKSEVSQYQLIKFHNISAGQVNRLRNNLPVSTETIRHLCSILKCNVMDIMEFIPSS